MDDKLKLRKRGSYSRNGGEIEITGVLRDRRTADGRRRLGLNRKERSLLRRQEMIEKAVVLFLDLEQAHTYTEIAAELGLSLPALKDLTRTKEFMDTYSSYFLELGHDPRIRATQAAIADLLPMAVNTLRDLLSEGRTPASVKLAAIREVFSQAGISAPDGKGNDRGELAEFLKKAGVQIGNVNIGLPLQEPEEVVDGTFHSDSPLLTTRTSDNDSDSLAPDDIPA